MRIWCAIPFAAVLMLASCGADAPAGLGGPTQVILLRHAEKPDVGNELSPRGMERAQALVTLFTKDARVLEHGPAAAIYAMKPPKGGSMRPIETMEPTAHALKLKLDRHFSRDEATALARAIRSAHGSTGKTVIVCWEHDALPDIVKALGWKDAPDHYPGKAYDRLWILDFKDGVPVRFRDLPQKLLPGDSPQ